MTPQAQTSERERLIADRADWLVDAVAMATQNRMFLRGEPECDSVACEAIEANGAKAMRVLLDKLGSADAEKIRALEARVDAWQSSVKCYLLGRFSDLPQHVAVDCVNRAMATLEESVATIAATQSPRSEARGGR